jgi:predicted ATPase/DNA-binding SARP family transcriptional activator
MRCGVLGPVEVETDDGLVIAVTSPSQRIVLAVLVARANQVVPRDELVEALWGDDPPPSAVHSLRTYVSRLRALTGPALASRAGGFALDVASDCVDAVRFETLVGAASTGPPTHAVDRLREALDLWRGPAFCDCADVDAVRSEAIRLDEGRRAAREALAGALLASGRVADAVGAAEGLVADEPLREGAWGVLVRALTAAGRSAEALRAYQRACEALADVGLEPSAALRSAEASVLAGSPADGVDPATRVLPLPPRPPRPSLVGRDDELREVGGLLRTVRLVTLVGPGGVGKTRLATEIAARVGADHRFGWRLIELAGVVDPSAVVPAVIDGLGMTDAGSPQLALEQAGSLDLLVLLDNCEHVLDAAADVAEQLLRGGQAYVLATSRERLGVDGEHVRTLGPLATDGDSPARALFLERARSVAPHLVVTDADLAAVDGLVRRLAGLPLAIEMAAARLATMTVPELAEMLDERLDLLRSPRRHGDSRHRTLRSVIQWSERLLSDDERSVFRSLSVFAGPVTSDHIEGVLGRGTAEVVRSLAGKSLVHADLTGHRASFSLLETVRGYAAEQAATGGIAASLSRSHAWHFAALAQRANQQLRTEDEVAGAIAFEEAFGELRAAHRWCRRNDPDRAAALSMALHLFAYFRLRAECFEWASPLADMFDADDPRSAVGLLARGARAGMGGELDVARQMATAALERTDDDRVRVSSLEVLGDASLYGGRLAEGVAIGRRMADLGRRLGDEHYVVMGACTEALGLGYAGRVADARAALDAVDRFGLAPSNRGWLEYSAGEVVLDDDPAFALAALDRAVALAEAGRNRFLAGVARLSITSLRSRIDDPAGAFEAFADVIGHWSREGDRTQLVTTLRNLVVLFHRVGAADAAARLLGTVSGTAGAPTFGAEAERLVEARRWAVDALGAERFAALTAEGAAQSLVDATDAALDTLARLDGQEAAVPGGRRPT